jgi:DNA-binding NarL/FixJ family response regulator
MTIVIQKAATRPADPGGHSVVRKRVLVVDDHAAVRAGLRELLAKEADFELVDAVSSAEAAISIAEREPVDVVVVDYQLGGRNGLWLSRKLKRLEEPPAVLVYSGYADGVLAAAAVVAQADAIVSKAGLGDELCHALRQVACGRRLMPPLPPKLADSLRRRLDHQEQAIFGMLLAGIKPPAVARTLGVSEVVLESQLSELLQRLEALPAQPAL